MKKTKRQIRIDGCFAYIPLTLGHEAVVDAADVHLVNGFNWKASKDHRHIYAVRKIRTEAGGHRHIRMHRAILCATVDSGLDVDHINGNGLDNRRCNIRFCTKAQNARNQQLSNRNTSGCKGVYFDKNSNKWRARIMVDKKFISLGYYSSIENASFAYEKASIEHHGEFSRVISTIGSALHKGFMYV